MKLKIKYIILIFYLFFCNKNISQVNFNQSNSINVIENNSILENAWAGGLNFCQFSEVDLNLDGKKDILIFDRSGKNTINNGNRIVPMLYIEETENYVFAPEYIDNFPQSLENWVLLVDYNQDGKEDIFTSTSNSIALFTNISSEILEFEFTKILTTDSGFGATNLYVDGVDLPAIVDIDNDCDIDVLSFNYDGTYVELHQNKSMELYGVCSAIDLYKTDNCWGNFKENFTDNDLTLFLDEDCQETDDIGDLRVHAGSTLLALDLNPNQNEGMELLIGDISYGNIVMVLNGGSQDDAYIISQDQSFPNYNQSIELPLFPGAFLIDVDKDDLKDLIISPNGVNISENLKNCLFYKNIGINQNNSIQFEFIQNNLFVEKMIDVGSSAIPILHDLNGDGLLDLVIGNKGYYNEANYNSQLKVYRNIGNEEEAIFELISNDLGNLSQLGNIASIESIHPTFGDLDQDLDQDLIIGTSNGKIYFIENIGNNNDWPIFNNEITDLNIDVGSHASPQLIDLNRDGLLDLVIGERSGKDLSDDPPILEGLNYFQNIGSETSFQFDDQTPIFYNLDGTVTKSLGAINLMNPTYLTAYTVPFFFEFNEEYYLAIGTENGRIHLYNNIENNIYGYYNPFSTDIISDLNAIRSCPTIGDINNDNLPDLIRGNASGGVELYFGSEFNLQKEENLKLDNDIIIYPNPNKGSFIINSNELNELNVKIFSITGKLMSSLTINQGENLLEINDIKPGIYLIKIDYNQNNIKTSRLIIN